MANGKQKKSKKKIYIFGGIGVVIIALILFALFGGNKEEIVQVQTEPVAKRDITQTVSATGKINSEFKVTITPEVTGEIVSLPVKEGDLVKKGQLLIKIKADAYVAQQQRAEANLSSAKSSLALNKAQLDKITADYNRTKEMHIKKLASDSDLETAKSTYLSAVANYEGAQATILQMEASLKETNQSLYKTTINSPMDGTISQLNVQLGDRVLGSGFSQGTDIMTVSDLRSMIATVQVDENDVVLVALGDTARIKVDAYGDRIFKGTVYQIGNSATATGTGTQEQVVNFDVKIRLIDADPGLRPGMSCNATIETQTINNVLSIPIQSVTARSEDQKTDETKKDEDNSNSNVIDKKEKKATVTKPKEVVFVVQNNKAKMKEVKTGLSDDNYIEIKEGLKNGEMVVSGSYRAISRDLNDGSKVKLEEKKTTSAKK
ncbi:MAG: efflux RND transporter periplasmic adaptor subunit [Ignavibacteriaceae bacterium]|nr:efflux RND transporter periplasmic adaptor subunit [Ignavibacteriaceae bacterium]